MSRRIIFWILSISLTILTSSCLNGTNRDREVKNIVENIRYMDKFIIKRGIYKDCTFIVQNRISWLTFSGTVNCPQNPDTTMLSETIVFRDLLGIDYP